MNEFDKDNHRDFVDFLIGLYEHKKVYIVILTLFLSLSFYYDSKLNLSFKYIDYVKIEDASALQDIINHVVQVDSVNQEYYKNSKALIQNDYYTLNYEDFSSDLCVLMKSSTNDYKFFDNMANVQIKNSNLKNTSISEVAEKLQSMISIKEVSGLCATFKVSGKIDDVIFLQNNLVMFLNSYLANEISSRLKILMNLNKQLGIRKKGIDDESIIINFDTLPDTDINYIKYRTSNITKNMNSFFIYVFAGFLSFLTHVIIVLSLDLVSQVKSRQTVVK